MLGCYVITGDWRAVILQISFLCNSRDFAATTLVVIVSIAAAGWAEDFDY